MISISILDSHRARAVEILQDLPVWKGSHRGEAANQVGVLGEVIVREQLSLRGVPAKPIFTTSHDLELSNQKRIEVKTKDRTVPPKPDYECSVPRYNHEHQDVDYYIFVSLQRSKNSDDTSLERFQTCHIVGVANQRMMKERGIDRETGETDPRNGTTFWTACRNIYIRDLASLDYAVGQWKKT